MPYLPRWHKKINLAIINAQGTKYERYAVPCGIHVMSWLYMCYTLQFMQPTDTLTDFAYLLLFLIGGAIFVTISLTVGALIRPKRPNEEKLTTYECGEAPQGSAWGQFNIRFYIVALIFVLFDVEIVFLFPWATVFGQAALIEETAGLWGWFSLAEAFIFVGILALGLAYAWNRGFLDWVKPDSEKPQVEHYVPEERYRQLNERYAKKVGQEP